jgi:hypothetical protein
MNLSWIKKVYLYMVSLISLIIIVVAAIMLLNLALRTWIFPKADDNYYYPPQIACEQVKNPDGSVSQLPPNCGEDKYSERMKEEEKNRRTAQKQSNAAQALAMLIVASPVFYYHWKLARKEQ